METVLFEPSLNEWYIPQYVTGLNKRAYLKVFFAENEKQALEKALTILAVVNIEDPSNYEIPHGLLYEYTEDFREYIR